MTLLVRICCSWTSKAKLSELMAIDLIPVLNSSPNPLTKESGWAAVASVFYFLFHDLKRILLSYLKGIQHYLMLMLLHYVLRRLSTDIKNINKYYPLWIPRYYTKWHCWHVFVLSNFQSKTLEIDGYWFNSRIKFFFNSLIKKSEWAVVACVFNFSIRNLKRILLSYLNGI